MSAANRHRKRLTPTATGLSYLAGPKVMRSSTESLRFIL